VAEQASYYERSVAEAREDYYAGRGEAPGEWLGEGAKALGLRGQLAEGDLAALLRRVDPASGEELRPPAREREVRVERVDPRTGDRIVERDILRPVAAYDLTFGLPKSLSVIEALADPARPEGQHVMGAVREAHRAGIRAALGYLEEHALFVRTGKGGRERVPARGAVAAAFEHRTSRAQEPHRHTHVIVANVAQGPDGVWRALDGRAILGPARLAMGYLYQAEVRRVMREGGFRFGPLRKGMAELENVSREVLAELSTRRRQTVEHMAALGTGGYYAAQAAARATRVPKVEGELDLEAARAGWRARAGEHGLGRAELDALARSALARAGRLPAEAPEPELLIRELAGPEGLTARRNTFVRADAVRAVAAAHGQGVAPDRAIALVERFLRSHEVVELSRGRFTTRDLLAAEEALLDGAARGRRAGVGVLDPALVKRVLADHAAARGPLGSDQAAVVRAVASSGRALDLVQAHAGAGKTHVLGVISECYRRAGYEVVGVAPTARAARELRAVGVPARTMDALRLRLDADRGLPTDRPVVVLNDEAGMNPTRLWAGLAAQAERVGAKYVAAGDAAQLTAVAAGGAFAAISEREGTLTLDHVRRQRDPDHRRALCLLRAGDVDAYVGWQLERDLIRVGSRQEMVEEAVRTWAEAQADLPWGAAALLARDNELRRELNVRARVEARARGWVRGLPLEVGSRDYRVGDRVIARRNDRMLDTDNGDRGTVAELRPDRNEVVVLTDDSRRVVYPAWYLAAGLLEHAYAMTGHGAQGATVERGPRVARPEDHSREWTYTADARERQASPTFLVDAPPAGELAAAEEGHGPIGVGVLRRDPVARYLRSLARREAESLASEECARERGLGLPASLPRANSGLKPQWDQRHRAAEGASPSPGTGRGPRSAPGQGSAPALEPRP
jgi:conjugative relaxase-like TrwC/TraI family protein